MRLDIRPDYMAKKQELILVDGDTELILFSEENLLAIEMCAESWYMARGLEQRDARTLAESLSEHASWLWNEWEEREAKIERQGFERGRNVIIKRIEKLGKLTEEEMESIRDPRPRHTIVHEDGSEELIIPDAKEKK